MTRTLSRSTFLRLLAISAVALTLAAPALAGEFYDKNGAVLLGHDAVAYFTENKPVKGLGEFEAKYKGSTFYFASEANRATFTTDPARYAPQYGGFCAFGTAAGYKAKIDPQAFTIFDGKLYLNYDRDVQKQWSADFPGFIVKADKNWPTVSSLTEVYE